MQNQPQRKGGGDDGLMIIGALLIMITVMWFGFRDYVIYGVCRLLYWIYGVLPDAITPGNAAERRDMLLSAARYNHQVSLWDFISVMNDTASVLFPLFILIIGLFVWVISRNPYYRLTRKLTIRNLPWVMVKNYPGIAHILARFGHLDQLLLNEDPEEARSAQSPVEFAQEHNLIDTAKRRLRKKAAHKVFLSQVNLAPEGAALPWRPGKKRSQPRLYICGLWATGQRLNPFSTISTVPACGLKTVSLIIRWPPGSGPSPASVKRSENLQRGAAAPVRYSTRCSMMTCSCHPLISGGLKVWTARYGMHFQAPAAGSSSLREVVLLPGVSAKVTG